MIFRSPYPDVAIPEISVTELVLRRARQLGDKPALIDGATGRTMSYGQFDALVGRLAAGLTERGFGKGDVLAIYSPNVPEYAVAVHGAIAARGLVTTVNPLATAGELASQLNDSRAMYLITTPALLANAQEAVRDSSVREVFVFGEADGATAFESLLSDVSPRSSLEAEIDPCNELAFLPYSSGTTGLPKGVMLTHHNVVANCCQLEGFDTLAEDDTVIAFLPFFHAYGLWIFLTHGLSIGATIVTMERFDLDLYLRLSQDYRTRRAFVVPPVLLALANHPLVDRYDLSSLRRITSAAAPAGPQVCAAVEQRLGCVVDQGYGMTETSPVIHFSPADRPRPGSVGVVIRNSEVRIVDASTGQDLAPGNRGEIWVRGPHVMKGYLNRPDATAETITPDGWLKTGDIGYADDDGYFYIVDRVKELIKYKGYQVAPAELEAVLLSHPAILDAAVIPVPDDEAGEVPKAYLVTRDQIDADEVLAYVAQRVASYKRVRQVEFIDQIPKSGTGKILRRVLVERERERALAPA